MKAGDPERKVERMLRASKPAAEVPPGLESRILHAIARERPAAAPANRRWLPWLLLPAAAVLALLLARPAEKPLPPPQPQVLTAPAEEAAPPPEKDALALLERINPLARESRALKRDAGRAGRFLLECLPSLSAAEP